MPSRTTTRLITETVSFAKSTLKITGQAGQAESKEKRAESEQQPSERYPR